MKTLIFAHKGHVGATTDMENGVFINDPKQAGQLGCVVSTKEALITKEAKEIINNASREGGSFANMMLTKHADGSGSSIGVIGFGKHYFGTVSDLKIGRDCDKSILEDIAIDDTIVPDDFKVFVEKQIG